MDFLTTEMSRLIRRWRLPIDQSTASQCRSASCPNSQQLRPVRHLTDLRAIRHAVGLEGGPSPIPILALAVHVLRIEDNPRSEIGPYS